MTKETGVDQSHRGLRIGIDGDQWYVCNGLGLGDPRSKYSFGDTLRKAISLYEQAHGLRFHCHDSLVPFLDKTTAEHQVPKLVEPLTPDPVVTGRVSLGASTYTAKGRWVPAELWESQARRIAELEAQAKLYEDANGQLEARIVDLMEPKLPPPPNDELRSAAQAVVDRWDTPLWKDAPATATYIHALRDALGAVEPDTSRCDTGVKDQYGKPIFEGDRVRVNWLADIGITELDLEREGIVTYMPDGFTAAWFVRFDPPLKRGVCEGGTYESDGEMLVQTSDGDDYTHHFTKLSDETRERRCQCGRFRWEPSDTLSIQDSRGGMHYSDKPCTHPETGESNAEMFDSLEDALKVHPGAYVAFEKIGDCMICKSRQDLRCGTCADCSGKVSGKKIKGGHRLWETANPANAWYVGK